MDKIEETCVPSYVHRNVLAAWVAWWRLFASEALYGKYAPMGGILDFGAATGELAYLLPCDRTYDFVETNANMARSCRSTRPESVRRSLESLPADHYAAVFALDSLEHNENVASIVDLLVESLRSGGVMIISGPTENRLYKLGRRIAGFSGHYHKTTIYDIEEDCSYAALIGATAHSAIWGALVLHLLLAERIGRAPMPRRSVKD